MDSQGQCLEEPRLPLETGKISGLKNKMRMENCEFSTPENKHTERAGKQCISGDGTWRSGSDTALVSVLSVNNALVHGRNVGADYSLILLPLFH